jgi:arylformamidase
MVAITDWSRYDIMGQPLAGVVPISGLFDLGPFPHSFLASSLQLTASDMRRLSPQFAQLPPSLPPMAVTWGGLETSEFRRQSIDFTDRLTAAGHGAHAIAIDDTHHFTVVQELADPDGMLCNLICGFAEA